MKIDLTGQKFGRLTVLEQDYDHPLSHKRTYWKCLCDCGNIISVAAQSLRRKTNPTKSCGCIRKENNKKRKGVPQTGKVPMIGKKFGRLTVLRESTKRSGTRKKLMYHCICDCGNECDVVGEGLRNGSTKSCGCIYEETRGIATKNYCTYDLDSYSFGIGYCQNNTYFFFDKEDYDKIKDYCWWYDGRYVCAHTLKDDKYTTKIIRLHRVVMDIKDREKIDVDHINCVRYDCRKSNLRRCTTVQNAANKNYSEIHTTGKNIVPGVSKTSSGKWSACIGYNNTVIRLGVFDNIKDAVKARVDAEIKYRKDFRYNPNADKIDENMLFLSKAV